MRIDALGFKVVGEVKRRFIGVLRPREAKRVSDKAPLSATGKIIVAATVASD
jgi:hypothetical protein